MSHMEYTRLRTDVQREWQKRGPTDTTTHAHSHIKLIAASRHRCNQILSGATQLTRLSQSVRAHTLRLFESDTKREPTTAAELQFVRMCKERRRRRYGGESVGVERSDREMADDIEANQQWRRWMDSDRRADGGRKYRVSSGVSRS